MRIVQVASECHPFVKTGGLADAVQGLSAALAVRGHEVRVVLPAFRGALPDGATRLGTFAVAGAGRTWEATIWEAAPLWCGANTFPSPLPQRGRRWGKAPPSSCDGERSSPSGQTCRVWFVAIPPLYDRDGSPYLDRDGRAWWDNGERFAVFSRAAAMLALGLGPGAIAGWRAAVVHGHDWHAGLTSAFLRLGAEKEGIATPRTVFTIHNAAFQGWFPYSLFRALDLPDRWWDFRFLEAWGELNFLKAGVTLSDVVTTVSPGYAQELLAGKGDYGLQGALAQRAAEKAFLGIVNGIDPVAWNPLCDSHLASPIVPGRGFTAAKRSNRAALLARYGLGDTLEGNRALLVGFVGRLSEQKGVDWLLAALPETFERTPMRVVLLGSGDPLLERQAQTLAARYPQRLLVTIGYDESLAHLIYGGCDLFVMPSRFEPCGLAQLYAMRYGAVPVVRAVGGLRDTVIDESLGASANGFLFTGDGPQALGAALLRAFHCWRDRPRRWRTLVKNAMEGDYSWASRVSAYESLYRSEGGERGGET
ncbi:glycogen synthase [Hydrogenophilus thiooxidans]|uniref:glycogen synthase n=1 Tax=Hydrogenophilus thiooxidans TaxID=2820326 RepID=UPI001C233396|nr:glycogen synthase [Hydrogenophilus thiooxidans]